MKRHYSFLTLLCVSALGFSQDFKIDFEGTDPLNNLPAGVSAVDATAPGTGGETAYVYSKISGSNAYSSETQVANVIEVDPNDANNKILKTDYLGFLLLEEAAIGTGSFTISGYYNGNAYGANPQNMGAFSVTGSPDGGATWESLKLLHRYGNGTMSGLMSIPASSGFSMLNTTLVHFIFTFNAEDNIYRMYQNGTLVGTSSAQTPWTGKKVYIGYGGGTQDPATGAFTGPLLDETTDPIRNKDLQTRLDDIAVFKRAISDEEALTLYTEGSLFINNITKESFNAYPNPVIDYLNFSTEDITSVEIYNTSGSKVSTQKVVNRVNMTQLSQGVYIVKCKNKENLTVATISVIKK